MLCLTFIHNKPFSGFVDNKPCMSVIGCLRNKVKFWLRLASFFFEGMSMLIILQMTVLLWKMWRTHKPTGFPQLKHKPCGDQCVGADPANHQHREALSRKRCDNSSFLHRFKQDNKGFLWRLRPQANPWRVQRALCTTQKTQVFSPWVFFAAPSWN